MPKGSISVKTIPYPTLEDGNFSFPNGNYSPTAKPVKDSENEITVEHKISGAAFIERLIEEESAKFACLVSSPKTAYRKIVVSDSNNCIQKISWDLDVVGEPPILGPLILFFNKDIEHTFTEKDGVAETWEQQTITIPKGARLARGGYLHAPDPIQNLLKLRYDDKMEKGSFKVEAGGAKGEFYFYLIAAPDVHMFLNNNKTHEVHHSIATHAVSQCFNILQQEYGIGEKEEKKWESYSNLNELSDWLHDKNMPHWTDEEFDPMEVATKLHPAKIPLSKG